MSSRVLVSDLPLWCRLTCSSKPRKGRPLGAIAALRIPMSWVIFNISAVDPKADFMGKAAQGSVEVWRFLCGTG